MEAQFNSHIIDFKISEYCIDVYVDGKFIGGFNIQECEIIPESIDLESLGLARKGIYGFVIDTITDNEQFKQELFEVTGNNDFELCSYLRSEAACNFWLKRGEGEEYNEEDHLNGDQETIRITL